MNEAHLSEIVALRHELHACAELSMHETQTMRVLTDFLRTHTALNVVQREGWFYAVKPGVPGKKTIALRADMDALPIAESLSLPYASRQDGVSHKCGHDGHCAALCGVALELDDTPPQATVCLLFQPAEETGRGASICRTLLQERGISEIYAFHNLGGFPQGSVVYRRGLTQPASEGLRIRMTGKTAHAAAPESGRSPVAALAALALAAQAYTQTRDDDLLLCTVAGLTLGSGDFGISPGEGEICLTLRSNSEVRLKQLERDLLSRAEALAGESGVGMEYAVCDAFPQTRNHSACLDRVLRAADSLALQTIEMPSMWRASEDFGHYLHVCPGAMFYIGTGEAYAPLHTAAYDFNDAILGNAVDLFTAVIRDFEKEPPNAASFVFG